MIEGIPFYAATLTQSQGVILWAAECLRAWDRDQVLLALSSALSILSCVISGKLLSL